MVRGYDVSKLQGTVDWTKEKARGIAFSYLACTVGNDSVDSFFGMNATATKNAGVLRGPYHFCYPLPAKAGVANRDPKSQMELFFSKCAGLGANEGDLPPMLDAEWPQQADYDKWGCSNEQIRDWLLAAVDAATGLFGVKPVLYTYPYWWAEILTAGGCDDFAQYPVSFADYEVAPGAWPADGASPPKLAAPWAPSWTFWQTTGGKGANRVTLTNGCPVDTEVFNGTMDDLLALTRRGAPGGAVPNV